MTDNGVTDGTAGQQRELLKQGWTREGTAIVSPRGIPEADFTQTKTYPIAYRVPGGSAPPRDHWSPEEKERWHAKWAVVGGLKSPSENAYWDAIFRRDEDLRAKGLVDWDLGR